MSTVASPRRSPTTGIGFRAAAIGLGGAVAFGVLGYVIAIAARRLSCPRTHGKDFVPVE